MALRPSKPHYDATASTIWLLKSHEIEASFLPSARIDRNGNGGRRASGGGGGAGGGLARVATAGHSRKSRFGEVLFATPSQVPCGWLREAGRARTGALGDDVQEN